MNVSRVLSVRAVCVAAVLLIPSQALAQTAGTALVRHAPAFNNGTVDGSVQQLLPESVTLNGGVVLTGDLLVPGLPTVRLNGKPAYTGTVDGTGSASPSSHQVTINGNVSLRHVVRRTDAVTLPVVSAPPAPAGTRTVTINAPGQSAGDFATLRHLTLNGNAGQCAIPPGTYGDFTANGGSGFTLGVAGGTQPAVYHFQRLTLNGPAQLQVAGPVIVNVANGFAANGTLGTAAMPSRLTLNVSSGGVTLNGGCNVYGYVNAPNSTVTLNGNSQLIGRLACDRLTINGGGMLRLVEAPPANQPPSVAIASPANGATFTAPAALTLVAAATDSDGTVVKVEFFQGATTLGEDASAPYQQVVSALPAGSYAFTARAIDNLGATTDAAPIAITVTAPAPNQPPSVQLTSPADGALLASETSLTLSATATDSDGTIAQVEFFHGATRLGFGVLSGPTNYGLTLPAGLAPGSYAVFVRATDNRGAVTDSVAVAFTVLARLPYSADFEAAEGFTSGPLAGQRGWHVSAGEAMVVSDAAYSGARSVLLAAGTTLTQVDQIFSPLAGASTFFVEVFVKPVADADLNAATRLDLDGARMVLRRNGAMGELRAFSGDGAGGGLWQATGFSIPLGADGAALEWVRLTVRLDFASRRWDLFAGGALVAADLNLRDPARTTFGSVALRGHAAIATRFDYLFAATTNPLFVDADQDGMDDAWELQNGLNPALNDRNADADADGLSNVQEFLRGTRANLADTDGDGMADGWEVQHGFSPRTAAVALLDTDGDGLTDREEFLAGTNPRLPDTDGDGLPDEWEVRQGLNALVSDAGADPDGDGVSNLQEYFLGRNPTKGAVPDTSGAVNLRLYSPNR